MRNYLVLLLAAAASANLASAGALHAREVARDLKHYNNARDMSADKNRIEKRYPPNRETFIPTTTPVWMASQTPAATSTSTTTQAAGNPTTTPAPSGQFATPTSRALVAATTSSATTCAPPYFAPTTIAGTGTLPKPTGFVRKRANRGQELVGDGNQRYVIVGPNMYWLCQDENYGPVGSYTDKARVREALAIAVAMGANTIRVLSCGISVGPNNPYNLEPGYQVFNQAAWDIRDYVLYAAREYGLRVIMTMVDNYDYYHGGKYDFIDFRRASRANSGYAFYQNRAVQNAYGWYIQQFLLHVNAYTGVEYRNDPTILAWETGNELGGYINAEAWPPTQWTTAIIKFISAYDTNHMIIDGTNGTTNMSSYRRTHLTFHFFLFFAFPPFRRRPPGFWNYTNNAISPGLSNRGIDIVTDHGYPRNTGILNREIAYASQYFKGFFIGEYDWTSTNSAVSLDTYIALIETQANYLGDMIWNVMGHDPQCCAFVSHNDGYSLYYPNGNSAADQANALKVVQHWYRVTGRAIPNQLPAVQCPQPVF
ncbi:hypothetical protein JCM11251_007017 [Rhodosporidiobolus azoricus]